MTDKELIDGIKELGKKYHNDKWNLYREYALERARYKVGDIIEAYGERIEVEEVSVYMPALCSVTAPYYIGKKLTKQNKPYKSGEEGRVYPTNEDHVKLIKQGV